ncbi:DUF6184 family natural product biosynthesis lipoprotein [Melittangium boletus]|uniref:Lipoprotein n=1 Tax=Melittangium boletus DSM 14713 TaxID=1294270 RepID=A0A250IFK6_9BACT|nr:DUF6184 family natural product biosynthesis lipoprotein [Melittangium boletus]ATB29947.1 hypothetical protein MEBOL_003402 [Melittangium boletus DSM 14713]
MKMNLGLMVAGVVGLFGCGGTVADITNKQSDAVNAAAGESCDRYQDCEEIGAGKKYETRDACLAENKDFWNGRWEAADCDGHINGDSLDVCLNSIKTTSCGSIIDQIDTAYNRCAKADVCK